MSDRCNIICNLLAGHAFDLENEKILQNEIGKVFLGNSIPYIKEYKLDDKNIIDFMVFDDIGIEIKIKGSRMDIYQQCVRYTKFDLIKEFILITSKGLYMPESINGKPVYRMSLASSWL
jgi:hypothetical protein